MGEMTVYLGGSISVLMTVYLSTVYLRIAFFMSVYDPTHLDA